MEMDKQKNRQRVKKSDLSISAGLMIGILVVINFLSSSIFYRLDLTEDKIYSISEASKKTVADLPDVVNVKTYFSDNLPSQLLSLRQEVNDTLAEYAAYSNGKFRIEAISPADDEKTTQELYFKGIPQLTFEVVERDKQQLVKGYMGMTISYGDKTEVIPALKQDISDLEYQITTKIKKVTSEEAAVVGFLSSHGSVDLEENLSSAREALRELYEVRDVELAEENPKIEEDIKTLIIVGPKDKFNEDQQKVLNDFLSRGSSMLVLLDGINIGEGLATSPNESGLSAWLEKYGLKVEKNLVADSQSGMASFSQGFFSFSTPYPFWPKIIGEGFNKDYSAVSGLENVVLPWASSVSADINKLGETKAQALLSTTEKSWTVADNFQIMPNQTLSPATDQKSSVLAMAINGEVKNPYPGEGKPEKFNTRLAVVGDSDFATNGFVNNNPDNLNLFLNLVDSLSLDDALIQIRSKNTTSRPIDETKLDDAKRASIRYVNVFGVTALVIGFGIFRYYSRRKNRFADEF